MIGRIFAAAGVVGMCVNCHVCGDRHIAHSHQKPPYQDETADHAAEDEIQSEQRDPTAKGPASRHDPEAHPMETEGQAAADPEPYIIQLAALHADGFENTVQQQGRRHGQNKSAEKSMHESERRLLAGLTPEKQVQLIHLFAAKSL